MPPPITTASAESAITFSPGSVHVLLAIRELGIPTFSNLFHPRKRREQSADFQQHLCLRRIPGRSECLNPFLRRSRGLECDVPALADNGHTQWFQRNRPILRKTPDVVLFARPRHYGRGAESSCF